jgi:eukaryotic-like serine/threonine-protein kinase
MGGVLSRVIYAIVLAGILATATWISFSRFVAGNSTRVPNLANLTVEEATARAAELGLTAVVDPAQDAFDDAVPAHFVRAHRPGPDTAVKEGQTVRLFVSLGPKTVRMPDLTGQSKRTATVALVRQGLPEPIIADVRLAGPAGVVAQGIAPGAVASPGEAVGLLVNRGLADPAWVMPDVIGRDFERVRTAFEARGFRLGGVKSQAYEGAAAGTILRQFPQAGFPVTRKEAVSFVVASREGAP